MACLACGRSISMRVAPRFTRTSSAVWKALRTSGSTPLSHGGGHADARAFRTSPPGPTDSRGRARLLTLHHLSRGQRSPSTGPPHRRLFESAVRFGRARTQTQASRTGHPAVRWLETDDPAKRGRLTDRPSRIGSKRGWCHPCRHRYCRPSARASRDVIERPGVTCRSKCGVLGR